jgi:hypothetical protein
MSTPDPARMVAASLFLMMVVLARVVLVVMMFFVLVADRLFSGLSHVRLEHVGQAADHQPVG